MRAIPLLCLALHAIAFTATTSAQMGVTTRSLEWLVARADAVVVATVANVQRGRADDQSEWAAVTLSVRETIKGPEPATITFAHRISRSYRVYEGWRDEEIAHLWFLMRNPRYGANGAASVAERFPFEPMDTGWHVIRLAPSVPAERSFKPHRERVFTTDLQVLSEPDEILRAARRMAAFEGPQGSEVVSHDVLLPREVMARLELPGDVNSITVPVDERLEPVARRLIEDPEMFLSPMEEDSDEDEKHRASRMSWREYMKVSMQCEGVKALQYFRSPENAELLRPFLDHPRYSHRRGDGLGEPHTRAYYIRKEAFEILTEWGEDVAEPVLAEPIVHTTPPPSTAAITTVHGPVEWNRPLGWNIIDVDIPIELNDSSPPELLRLLINTDKGVETEFDLDKFRDSGALVQGFALFAWAHDEPVLVFYTTDPFDGFPLQLIEMEHRPVLFQPGDRDPTERAWGWWFDRETGWAGWEARQRIPDGGRDVGWKAFPHIHVPRAK